MKKQVVKSGFILIAIAVIFASSRTFSVNNSYAQIDKTTEELNEILSAFEKMDKQSQNQIISILGSNTPQIVNVNNMQNLTIEEALMHVQSQRVQLLEEQLAEQIERVKKRNKLIADLNNELAALEREKSELPSNNRTAEENNRYTEIEQRIKKINEEIERVGNTQQLDMLRLQSLANKRNEAFDDMTNLEKEINNSPDAILSKKR